MRKFDINSVSNREARRDEQRRIVLDAAAEILVNDGRNGLSARVLAQASNCSTKIIYTHFGGMDGVITAIYTSAFAQLAEHMALAEREKRKPVERLRLMANAYRLFLLEHQNHAELMYSRPIQKLAPQREDRSAATSSLNLYVQAFQKLGHKQEIARDHALAFWAGTHGAVMLELSGWTDGPKVFDQVLEALLSRYSPMPNG